MSTAPQSKFRKSITEGLIVFGMPFVVPLAAISAPVDQLSAPQVSVSDPQSEMELGESVEASLLAFPQHSQKEAGDNLPSVLKKYEPSRLRAVSGTELLQQRFANGKIQIERYVSEDASGNLINHGPYKEYDASGTVIRSGNYVMGQLDGTWSQLVSLASIQSLATKLDAGFRPPFKSEANFISGQLHGDWTISDSKGNPVLVWQFELGKRENVSTWFDSRHVAILEITFTAGVPHGPSSQTVPGQREPKKTAYDQGRIVQSKTNWYERDKKRSEETLLVPSASALVAHDWWNSSVQLEPLPAAEAIRHGSFSAWHASGQKSVEGQFINGEPTGEFRWWYANGQPQTHGFYDSGESVGHWIWWHPNGMKKIEGTYEGGEQVGVWSQWEPDGILVLRDGGSSFPLVKHDLRLEIEQITKEQVSEATRRVSSIPAVRRSR